MSRRVVFSPAATADAREITRFGIDRFGGTVGQGYVRDLRAACKRLGDFPALGRLHPTIDPPARVLVHRSRRVFHRVEPDRVLIVRILHHARATPPAL